MMSDSKHQRHPDLELESASLKMQNVWEEAVKSIYLLRV